MLQKTCMRWDSPTFTSYLSHIIYYIVPLTIIIVVAIKAVGFSKVWQTQSTKFAMHYDDIKDKIWICLFGFFIKIYDFMLKKMIKEMKGKTQKYWIKFRC